MEHEWGRNVVDLGLGDRGITLASRYLAPADRDIVTNEPAPAGFFWYWVKPANTQPNVAYQRFIRVKLAPHFPYGQPVQPDAPL